MRPAYATAGERKIQTSTQIVDGLTYKNTVTDNGGSRVESFALELVNDQGVLRLVAGLVDPVLNDDAQGHTGGHGEEVRIDGGQHVVAHLLGAG